MSGRVYDGTQLRCCGELRTADNADQEPCRSRADECGLNVAYASSSKLNTNPRTSIHCRPLHASAPPNLTMPPKQRTAGPQTIPGTPYSAAKPKSSNDAQDIVQGVYNRYVEKTSQRTKLLDSFMLFLVVVGALQFLYVVLVGNFVSSAISIHLGLVFPDAIAASGLC